jgi:hypothetical protein
MILPQLFDQAVAPLHVRRSGLQTNLYFASANEANRVV